MGAEVGLVLGEDLAQVALVHDEDPVEELAARPVVGFAVTPSTWTRAFFEIAQMVAGAAFGRQPHDQGPGSPGAANDEALAAAGHLISAGEGVARYCEL